LGEEGRAEQVPWAGGFECGEAGALALICVSAVFCAQQTEAVLGSGSHQASLPCLLGWPWLSRALQGVEGRAGGGGPGEWMAGGGRWAPAELGGRSWAPGCCRPPKPGPLLEKGRAV
jgi:hypothetical protein